MRAEFMNATLSRALVAEFLGTAFLLIAVCGSGALAHSLDQGNVALSVLCVAFATGTTLCALILMLDSVSAHFNPLVTITAAIRRDFAWPKVLPYVATQVAGAIFGVVIANLMFDLPPIVISETARTGAGQLLAEVVASFGLLGVIFGCGKSRPAAIPFAVPAYVAGAIYFTSSTCFANPAVTIARIFTNTLTGILPAHVPAYIAAQCIGAVLACVVFGWLFASVKTDSDAVQSDHDFAAGDEQYTSSQSAVIEREPELSGSASSRR
jgi:glycerol uptake facilitator-like aquaporin